MTGFFFIQQDGLFTKTKYHHHFNSHVFTSEDEGTLQCGGLIDASQPNTINATAPPVERIFYPEKIRRLSSKQKNTHDRSRG